MRKAGRARIDAKLKKHGARRHAAWAGRIVSALGRQTVTVTGTEAAGTVLPHLARQLIAPRSQRADVAARVETLVRAHPLHEVLTSMPGVGVGTAAVFLAETLGKTFDTGAQPASHIRPGPGHTPLRLIDPRRARLPHRQQETQTRHVPVRPRLPERSRLPYLLPAQTGPGQAPWARPCSPWPTAASSPCTP